MTVRRDKGWCDVTGEDAERTSVLVSGDQTNGLLTIIERALQHGGEAPRHLHTREDEVVYVLEGHVSFHMDGRRVDLRTGMSAVLPRGREHFYCVESDLARMLHIFAPAGLEAAVAECSDWKGPAAVEQLVTTAARYGVEITGPPPGDGVSD